MKEIQLTVTIEEANLILRGIGLLPFAEVYQLVAKVQEQAARQLRAAPAAGADGHRPEPAVAS